MYHFKSLNTLVALLREKKVSYTELTTYFLQRIKKFDFLLNSFVTVDSALAMLIAKSLDSFLVTDSYKFFFGLPFALKDNFCTKGLKTSCCSRVLSNFIPSYDSTVTYLLKKCNFILLGKTNMDEFAMGSSGETSYYGNVRNPWDLTRSPGGSSSGSASCVAAGLVPFSIGSDTGGSVRQPASFCGISGLKLTYGLISRYGLISFSSSLDQCGILAKTAADCAFVLEALTCFDFKDFTESCKVNYPYFFKVFYEKLDIVKIGVLKESYDKGVSEDVLSLFEASVSVFKNFGFSVQIVSIPSFFLSLPAYYVFSSIECSSNLLRYDGIRYNFFNELKVHRDTRLGVEVKRRILLGTHLLVNYPTIDFYYNAKLIQNRLITDCINIFKKVDIILCPTTSTEAFKIEEKIDDPLSMYLTDIFTCFVNLAGLPAISIPIGFSKNMLPIGVQLIGRYYEEGLLLNIAQQYQNATKWHLMVPPLFV